MIIEKRGRRYGVWIREPIQRMRGYSLGSHQGLVFETLVARFHRDSLGVIVSLSVSLFMHIALQHFLTNVLCLLDL